MNISWDTWENKEYHNDVNLNLALNRYSKLFKFHKLNAKKMDILEIGCGNGRETYILSKMFKNILALDPSEILINSLNEKKKIYKMNNVTTMIGNSESININKKFDMIIFTYSFLFVKNKQKCLLKINNLLKKNGYLLLLEPARFNNLLFKTELSKKKIKDWYNLLNDTLIVIIKSKKFKLIQHLNLFKFTNTYLLKKN